jgi:TonB-dependent SusC/RagA subfamily outer membrane receptor
VYDSAEFGISTANGKKGKLILHPREVPPIPKIEHDFVMKYKEEKFRGVSIPNNSSDQTTLLREVTVKGYQLIEKPQDPIYGTPDISISKEETAKFLTVLDAILSKVSNAYVLVDQSTKLNIGIAFGSFSTKRDIAVPALVVIDGVPLPYYDLTSISPLDVERIDILKYASTAIYGFYGAGGVVLIHTKKGNEKDGRKANHNELDWKMFERLVLHGYSPTRSFAAPDYSQPEKLHEEIQDARSTIYWEPKINTTNGEASISFYSADEETKYRIVVEGMTLNGKPVRCVSFVDVKK